MSDFIESVDDMIASHFAFDARLELRKIIAHDPNNWPDAEKILRQLILASIAHARAQTEGREAGTMTFDQAISRYALVTRPTWNIFRAIKLDFDGSLLDFTLDNCDGTPTGSGGTYTPTDEDRAAADWMVYQPPQDNWVELDF